MAIIYYNSNGKIGKILQASKKQIDFVVSSNPKNTILIEDSQINWNNLSGMSVSDNQLIGGLSVSTKSSSE